MPTNKRNTRRTTVTVTYRKRKAKETPVAVKRTNNKKKKTKDKKAKTKIAKKEADVFDLSEYLDEIGELEKTVVRTEEESEAISATDVTKNTTIGKTNWKTGLFLVLHPYTQKMENKNGLIC